MVAAAATVALLAVCAGSSAAVLLEDSRWRWTVIGLNTFAAAAALWSLAL